MSDWNWTQRRWFRLRWAATLVRWILRLYQVSPFSFLSHCRYHPTCSRYSVEALQKWGFTGGVLMTLHRLSRCHPWGGSGMDPVPDPPVD